MPRFAHLLGSNLGEFFKEDDRVRLLLLHVKEVILPMSAGLAGAALLDLQDASAKSGPDGPVSASRCCMTMRRSMVRV